MLSRELSTTGHSGLGLEANRFGSTPVKARNRGDNGRSAREEEFGVALAGKLEDVQPAEILQFLAMSEKTGKLSFTTGTQEGLIVFRGGKIIYAASSSVRETFGSIALSLGMVQRLELDEALLAQHRSGEDKRLGEILVEMEAISKSDLQRALHHQVIQVLREMFGWKRGFFRFRNLDIEASGEVEVDAQDLVMGTPIDARRVALDAARRQDEERRDLGSHEGPHFDLSAVDDGDEDEPERTTLTKIIGDVGAPVVTAEKIREIFDTASRIFSRGVVFAVHSHGVRGLAQFGLVEGEGNDPPSQRVRRLWLPIEEASVISYVVSRGVAFRGRPARNQWNNALFAELGGGWPDEGVAIPLVVHGAVALVFYGDNEPDDLPVGSIAAVEAQFDEVAREMRREMTDTPSKAQPQGTHA